MAKPRPNKSRPPKRRLHWKLALALLIGFALFVVCVVYGVWASTFDLKQVENIPERSSVFDMDGKFYSRLAGENRLTVPLDKVSRDFQQALLAREDTRFYKHHGVDPVGIGRAIVRNLIRLHAREGASTLTQQLARNTFPLGGKNLHRKILEAFVSVRIEQNFTKQQILENYVNRIYFGSGVYGVETASQAYFGKHAADLSLGEAAMLVGIVRGPNKFSPFTNFKGAVAQRDTVLDRMAELQMIPRERADAAKRIRLVLARKRPSMQENYAMGAVRSDLDALLSDAQMDEGGLKVYTTIDPLLQRAAQASLETQLRKIESRPGWSHPRRADTEGQSLDSEGATPYIQGAAVVIDNRTGAIRAIVGGRDYAESRFNRALFSKRQVGSTFKPFVYAAAFARGLPPDAMIDDGPIRPGELRTVSNNWRPENSDGTYRGPMPAAEGLIQSRNTMSVRVGDAAGIGNVMQLAENLGLGKIPKQPSVFLGAFEATLKDLTSAYTVFPNAGTRRQSYIIERIDDAEGQAIYRAAHLTALALDPEITALTTSILQEVLDHGTAASARSLGWTRPAAGKTGTTNDFHDAWFVGYTRTLTCGVWVGFDKPQTIMPKGYGAALALPVWVETMNAAPSQKYPAPDLGRSWRSDNAPAPSVSTPERVEREIEQVPGGVLRSFRRFLMGH